MNRQVRQVLGLSAFAAGCMALGMGFSHRWVARAQEERPVTVEAKGLDRLPPITDVAEALNPTVVYITNTSFVKTRRPDVPDDFFDFFFGPGGGGPNRPHRPRGGDEDEQRAVSGGSGVIISSDGEILTNYHVIEGYHGSETQTEVKTSDGRTFKAKILGKDRELDIALIKIDGAHLPFAKLGDSDGLRIGEWVVAIGNPLGLEHTVTQGIISAKGRHFPGGGLESFLQTDAAINRGNSGGPLLNLRGEVVGINTAIRPDAQNIGFAVPVNMVRRVLKDLRSGKPVSRGYLGISTQELDSTFQDALGVKSGVVVADVVRGQAADKGGVQHGDVITAVDGQTVRTPDELVTAISGHHSGEAVKLTVSRDGKSRDLSVTLGDRKSLEAERGQNPGEDGQDEQGSSDVQGGAFNLEKSYGFNVEALSPANRHQYGVADELKGVVVTYVSPRSAAVDRGLAPGLVITEVGRRPVSGLQDFQSEVKRAGGRTLLLYVQAGNGKQGTTYAIPPR